MIAQALVSATHEPVPLRHARDASLFGGKAVQLGALLRARLPVPEGVALPWPLVDAFVRGEAGAAGRIASALDSLGGGPVAVRSSAVGEDSASASFAGVHATFLNVRDRAAALDAIRAVHASGSSDGAVAYRRSRGRSSAARVGVVVQRFLDAVISGVLFTQHPVMKLDERVIEASWGLGEAIVGGLVTPDHLRVSRGGAVREMRVGDKDLAVVGADGGGTEEMAVPEPLARKPCLGDELLRELLDLADRCEDLDVADGPIDVEWCVHGGRVHLLQVRPMTA